MREVFIFLMLCMMLFAPLVAEDIDELSRGVRQRRKERKEKRIAARKRKREERIRGEDKSKSKMSEEDILFIRNSAYDEILRKCRQITKDGEISYFSSEDLEEIVRNLKDRK